VTLGGWLHSSPSRKLRRALRNLVNYFGRVQTIKGALERLGIFTSTSSIAPLRQATRDDFPPKLAGSVEHRNISFGYSILEPPLSTICRSRSLQDPASRLLEFVQRKIDTRQVDLRAYSPGPVKLFSIDGHWSISHLRNLQTSVSYVDQDIFLFEGSARDNLTYGINH